MATLKEILGDSYKEDLTIADIEKLLSGKKVVDLANGEYVSKGKLIDAEKARKDAEKKLNDKLTEEEKAEAERAKREEYYKGLERENNSIKIRAKLSKTITDEQLLDEITELYANGDVDGALDKQAEYFANREDDIRKDEKAKMLKDNPEPHPQNPKGGTMTKDEIMKIADDTQRQQAIAENIDLFN